jgi:hypothetical protein
MILSCENDDLKAKALERPSVRIGERERLCCNQESALLAVIEAEINLAKDVESLKRYL